MPGILITQGVTLGAGMTCKCSRAGSSDWYQGRRAAVSAKMRIDGSLEMRAKVEGIRRHGSAASLPVARTCH